MTLVLLGIGISDIVLPSRPRIGSWSGSTASLRVLYRGLSKEVTSLGVAYIPYVLERYEIGGYLYSECRS